MRIGCCSNLLVGGPGGAGGGTGVEFVERIAAAGFDYVEMPIGQMVRLSERDFIRLTDRVAASGLSSEVGTNLFLSSLRLTGRDVDNHAIDAHVAEVFVRASVLGMRVLVFGSGQARRVPEGFSRDEAFRQLVELLQRVDPVARAHDITVVIEPLRRQESNIINTYEEGCRLAEAVRGSHIRVLVDYYHLATEREPVSHILEGAGWLRHAHCASLRERSFPTSLDDELNRDFFRALKTAGYNERISLEAFTDDFDVQAPSALAFIREQIELAEPFPRHRDALHAG